eukprot:13399683-Alexandrium_andersonii.AAC.1
MTRGAVPSRATQASGPRTAQRGCWPHACPLRLLRRPPPPTRPLMLRSKASWVSLVEGWAAAHASAAH